MICPWCKDDTPDCPAGTSAMCMKCRHWFLVPFKEDAPSLQVCKLCGRRVDAVHMWGDVCAICIVPPQ